MSKLLRVKKSAAGLELTLCRPEIHNALNDTLMDELIAALESAKADPSVRYVVLAGEGRSFCAGADLGWMKSMVNASFEQNQADAMRLVRLLDTMVALPLPIIGRVHGAALGGGMGLVAACDLVVAAPKAVFGLTEVRLGLAPAMIFPYLMRKVSRQRLLAAAITGDRFKGAEAQALGLVNEVTEELDPVIDSWAESFALCGREAVAAVKSLFDFTVGVDRDELSTRSSALIAQLRVGAEGQEGMHAFLERRTPSWRSK